MSATMLDYAYQDRAREITQDREDQRRRVFEHDYFWGPVVGETELEILWDKARLDAAEELGRIIIEDGVESIEYTYPIASKTAAHITPEAVGIEYYDCQGHTATPQTIVVYNYALLNNMLARIVGVGENGMLLTGRNPSRARSKAGDESMEAVG